MKRQKIIAGNWKMNLGVAEARSFVATLSEGLAKSENQAIGRSPGPELVVFPQAALLFMAKENGLNARLQWGAQNTYWEEKGAFTGELAPTLARDLGATYALAGHSERRQFFGETNESAVKRALFAKRVGLRPMLCIGETLAEREAGQTEAVLQRQLAPLFADEKSGVAGLSVAYEPVWAIGTGRTATSEQAEAVHAFLRGEFAKAWGADNAESLPLLYGGSVKVENAKELLSCPNIDGLLIGGASLDPKGFLQIAAHALV